MPLTNDERGWIMTGLSGLACIFGASVICVDVIIRQIPGKQKFRIQDSDVFLSVSLSLSFGVMLFSSLYSMLPSAKSSLVKGGFSPRAAAWILIACFIGGILGIQIISNILHRFMPSHVVDCEHSHEAEGVSDDPEARQQNGPHDALSPTSHPSRDRRASSYFGGHTLDPGNTESSVPHLEQQTPTKLGQTNKRPSLQQRLTAGITSIAAPKPTCDSNGPCHGYTEPCGDDCFKTVQARGGSRSTVRRVSSNLRTSLTKSMTAQSAIGASETTPLLQGITEEPMRQTVSHTAGVNVVERDDELCKPHEHDHDHGDIHSHDHEHEHGHHMHLTKSDTGDDSHGGVDHHHHVPNNAFLSIGLQTSIAIALHKLPEGFITYATNHANPKLGVAVFLALFIHNITEGFALALPLYLALNSRWKAMVISFVLGGLSQPLGAGVAALWFKLAGSSSFAPDEAVYGGMFAVTAGIMASVALQLFSESLDLTHSKTLCMIGAFSGMAILGISNALTA